MKILIDMNLSPDWVDVLAGHDITAVHWSTVGDPRAEDSELMSWARVNQHVVFNARFGLWRGAGLNAS